jgi:hypothetical protein
MFELGKISITEGAEHALRETNQTAEEFLRRHRSGDWGEISEETRLKNTEALEDGQRIESVFHTSNGEKILVVTEADRALTSIMRPEEF